MEYLAYFWDGKKQLSGKLDITEKELVFRFDNFQKSNLVLHIPLPQIQKVETFAVFSTTPNGIKVKTKSGRENCFVLENPQRTKKEIVLRMDKGS